MNRKDYIDRAAQHRNAKRTAIDLARLCASTQVLESSVTQMVAERSRVVASRARWRAGEVLGCLAVIVGLCVVFMDVVEAFTREAPAPSPYRVLVAFGVFAVCAFMKSAADEKKFTCNDMLHWMRPIAGTKLCHDAARYVEEGRPDVLAWRDLAIAERGQLHSFDVEMMRCLHDLFDVAQREQATHDACLKAHGIAPTAA